MKITCRRVTKLLPVYLDEELSGELQEQIKQHLNKCQCCSYQIVSLRRTICLTHLCAEVGVPQKIHRRLWTIVHQEMNLIATTGFTEKKQRVSKK